jgi:hypothetical protein
MQWVVRGCPGRCSGRVRQAWLHAFKNGCGQWSGGSAGRKFGRASRRETRMTQLSEPWGLIFTGGGARPGDPRNHTRCASQASSPDDDARRGSFGLSFPPMGINNLLPAESSFQVRLGSPTPLRSCLSLNLNLLHHAAVCTLAGSRICIGSLTYTGPCIYLHDLCTSCTSSMDLHRFIHIFIGSWTYTSSYT